MANAKPDARVRAAAEGWSQLRRPLWLFDPVSCRGLYANPPAMALWGADSVEELLARDFSKLSPAVKARTDRLAAATAGGEEVSERWTFYPKGVPVTVNATISAFPLSDGRNVLLFEATPVDVEESERRAVEALRHTSSLITLFDPTGRALFANPAAYTAYGLDTPGFADRFADAAAGAAAWEKVARGEILGDLIAVRTRAGGRWHHLDARQVVDPVSGETGVLLSERDVSAQIEAEQALRAAHERAEVAEAKQRFLANMSHELRTPLNTVLGFSRLLETGGLEPEQAGHARRITEAGEGLLAAVNDVILLSELDTGEWVASPSPFDPIALLEEALLGVEASAAAKGLALELACDTAPPGLVGDKELLKAAVDHLVGNAVKFTEAGQVCATLGWEADGDAVALSIRIDDTGPGMDDAACAQLFRPLTQGDDGLRKRIGGGGLGLAVVKAAVAHLNGAIEVKTAPGEGTSFTLRLSLPRAAVATDVAKARSEPEENRGAISVLYADDHQNNRLLVQAILTSQGVLCETVCDGAEAVQAVRERQYDVVLMDIHMPVLDGVGATREIRGLQGAQADIPILALTANTLSEHRRIYAEAGLDGCIGKPFSPPALIEQVRTWAAAWRSGRRRSAA
ncbi:MAG: response regulator [Proteobacteria bacterium]|nr:response regulator [Pseudomonadota bacterium]